MTSYQAELARVVEDRIGVRLHFRRAGDPLLRFVRERMRELGLETPMDYVAHVRGLTLHDRELRLLIEAATNGQTYFFRDPEQIDALADHLGRVVRGRSADVWCCGCATGEEAYSLAMACLERRIDVRILATDVNESRIEHARRAEYDAFSIRHVAPDVLARHFERVGARHRVRPHVRSRVVFAPHNLLSSELPSFAGRPPCWDAILCRNVFIYLARERVEAIVARMTTVLAPHGLLCLGTAESLHGYDVPLSVAPLGPRTAYGLGRRSSRPPPPRPISDRVRTKEGPARTPVPLPAAADAIVLEAIRDGHLADAHDRLLATPSLASRDDLYLSLGNAYLRAHDFEAAIGCYRHAAEGAPLDPEPTFFLGLAELKLGRNEDARDALRRVLFLEPTFWRASLLLAGILERMGKTAGATRELLHARGVLASGAAHPTYKGRVEGIAAATVPPDEARRTIELRLAALARTRTEEATHE